MSYHYYTSIIYCIMIIVSNDICCYILKFFKFFLGVIIPNIICLRIWSWVEGESLFNKSRKKSSLMTIMSFLWEWNNFCPAKIWIRTSIFDKNNNNKPLPQEKVITVKMIIDVGFNVKLKFITILRDIRSHKWRRNFVLLRNSTREGSLYFGNTDHNTQSIDFQESATINIILKSSTF